ncbi:MAG: type II toxin-antitoxin system VapC family toxin [Candidatus Poribacteria bacterium]|nr:type II toxin-antitoxin system VapC family toxin [Candidatus Poribacteria bacterium]
MKRLTHQNGKYLLDTNVLIALLEDEIVIQVQDRSQNATIVSLPAPAIGELYYGARKSGNLIENLARVNRLTQRFPLLFCDLETAQWYGIIKNQLRRKGRPIPNNDIWIAAIAMQHGLILVTRDSHFEEIESLQTERW